MSTKLTGNSSDANPPAVPNGTADGPRMVAVGDVLAPQMPANLRETGMAPEILADLVLKLAHVMATFTTEEAASQLCLPLAMVAEMLEQLKRDKLVEVLGMS